MFPVTELGGRVLHCRLGVLEKRIAEHNSITADKLAALEARLRADVRLAEAVRAGLV